MDSETDITTPVTEPKKAPRTKSIVNLRLIEALDRAERYVTVARRPEIETALAALELTPQFVLDLQTDIATCRGNLASFVQATTDRQVQTEKERTERGTLVALLQGVQNGAKRKWARKTGERDKLKGYYVGVSLKTRSVAELSEAADTILRQARLDALPGISAADLVALETAVADWKATNEAQAQAQNTATRVRGAADTLAKTILDRRIELQLAADMAFPYNNSENAATRKEFGLPRNGPYSSA